MKRWTYCESNDDSQWLEPRDGPRPPLDAQLVLASEYDEVLALVRLAHKATLDFCTTYNGRPSSWKDAELATAETLCRCNDELEAFLYPKATSETEVNP